MSKPNLIDLIKEKNKQIDELVTMVLDKDIPEVDKHLALDNYLKKLKELGALPNLLIQPSHIPMSIPNYAIKYILVQLYENET